MSYTTCYIPCYIGINQNIQMKSWFQSMDCIICRFISIDQFKKNLFWKEVNTCLLLGCKSQVKYQAYPAVHLRVVFPVPSPPALFDETIDRAHHHRGSGSIHHCPHPFSLQKLTFLKMLCVNILLSHPMGKVNYIICCIYSKHLYIVLGKTNTT